MNWKKSWRTSRSSSLYKKAQFGFLRLHTETSPLLSPSSLRIEVTETITTMITCNMVICNTVIHRFAPIHFCAARGHTPRRVAVTQL